MQYPDCMLCHDIGLVGRGGDFPFAFCKCPAGVKLSIDKPNEANDANAEYEKLMLKFKGAKS